MISLGVMSSAFHRTFTHVDKYLVNSSFCGGRILYKMTGHEIMLSYVKLLVAVCVSQGRPLFLEGILSKRINWKNVEVFV